MARLPSIENLSDAKIQLLKRKVTAAIKERNLIQRKVAEKAGVAATSLNRILNPRNPRFTSEYTARNLAKAIGLPYDVLIDEDYDADAVVKYIREKSSAHVGVGASNGVHGGEDRHDADLAEFAAGPADHGTPVPPHVAHLIWRVGIDEAVRRMLLNAARDQEEAVGCGPIPEYVAKMVEAIGPLRALKRILVNPDTGEVSL